MEDPVIECSGLTKEFMYREPTPGGTTSDMWVHYLLSMWPGAGRRDPFGRSRKWFVAVDGVDLEIRRGELFGLLGPNGAGKTTLIKMLATILTPTRGTARIAGCDVAHRPRQVRGSIAVISSGGWLGFDLQLPIEWNLRYWATLYGIDGRIARRRVAEVLEIVGLESKARESSSVLSSGMRQRLAIAKGLLVEAPVFLMDEPTVALDPLSANQIRSFIAEEVKHSKHTTILLTTQNLHEADELCDRIGILERGRLIACGRPERLKREMQNRVFRLVTPQLPLGVVKELRDRFAVENAKCKPSNGEQGGWLRFHLPVDGPHVTQIRDFLTHRKVRGEALEQVEPSLEDLYLSLTGKELKTDAASH
jgi:ABC-2 type transport system ATP-binding protein